MREQIAAMSEIWAKDKAEYHGDIVDFPPMMTWPKPVQKPRPPVLVGGAFPWAARRAIRYGDGWFPIAGGRVMATRSTICRASGKWRRRPAAIPVLCR